MLINIDIAELPRLDRPNCSAKELLYLERFEGKNPYDTIAGDRMIQIIVAILYQQHNTEFPFILSLPKISSTGELYSLSILHSLVNICDSINLLVTDDDNIWGLQLKRLTEHAVNAFLKLKKENKLDKCIPDYLRNIVKVSITVRARYLNTRKKIFLVSGIAHEINTPVGVSVSAASHMRNKTEELVNQFINGQLKKSALQDYFEDVMESSLMLLENLMM